MEQENQQEPSEIIPQKVIDPDKNETVTSEEYIKTLENYKRRTNWFIPLSIVIAGILISSSILYSDISKSKSGFGQGQLGQIAATPEQQVTGKVSADDDAFLGSPKAKVTVIEFSDFQCPFCRNFWSETLPLLKKNYIDTGKVKFVYRDFPLNFHPMAQPSALAAECAEEQNKYWEMHDKIFQEQGKRGSGTVQYAASDIKMWASQIGLAANEFNACFDSNKYEKEIQNDYNDGVTAGINGTPTLFINGRKVVGAQPYETLKMIIEEELKK